MRYPKIAQLKTPESLRSRVEELGIADSLPLDDESQSAAEGTPLAETLAWRDQHGEPLTVGNRWCIHPMEGWDANEDGTPSALTLRRWERFGVSGAKLIWGGEAAAVRRDGRANPRQTLATDNNRDGLAALRETLVAAHREQGLETDDLLVGLQLTHSGRFCRPNSKQLEPRIAYHHPQLDAKFGIDPGDDSVVWTDDQLEALIEDYVAAARNAHAAGFRFVDVKACHGYLLHEFLSARRRPGKFGGDFEGRCRLLLTIIERIQATTPELAIGVRLSVFDYPAYKTSRETGEPMEFEPPYDGFGIQQETPTQMDLAEPLELMRRLRDRGVFAVNLSCGSPYYCPHVQRPAIFPPSDGYLPPEDPLVGVARQIAAVRDCKRQLPDLPLVGTGYSYLQDYLPHVAQAVVKRGWVDSVGLGRMVLSYPELPLDVLRGSAWQRKKVCRTFSDCTTAPRNGIVSGCYPLDAHYKAMPEAKSLKQLKQVE